MTWTRGRFNNEYTPGLIFLAVDSYEKKRATSMWPKLCTIKSSKKAYEEAGLRSGLSTLRRKGEGASVTSDTQIGGPKQTWVHDTWALDVTLTEESIEDNLYELNGGGQGNLKEIFYDLGESAEETIESEIARFFNSGTATTYHSDRFGNALFSATQTRLDNSTYSNLSTSSDLTYQTFWSNLVSAENQVNHRQQRIYHKVKGIWVPPQLERNAREIILSPERPDTGNRAINASYSSNRDIQIWVWRHHTDVDAWILQKEGEGIIFFWRRKTRFARDKEFKTGNMSVKVDQRWSAEINDPQCFWGNIPS